MSSLGIVVPTLRGGDDLHRCLESIQGLDGNEHVVSTLVVIDGSDVHVDPDAASLRLAPGRGFAAAANAGVAALPGAPVWVAIVNDDAELDPRWLNALSLDTRRPDVGGIASDIRFESRRDIINSRGIGVSRAGWFHDLGCGSVAWAEPPTAVLGPAGAVAVYRRSAFLELGGYDERYGSFVEDVDLAWRMAASGWRSEYARGAIAYHRHAATFGQHSAKKAFLSARNRLLFRAKFLAPRARCLHMPGELSRHSLFLMRELRAGYAREWLKGVVAGIRDSHAAASAGRPFRASHHPIPYSRDPALSALRRKRIVDGIARQRTTTAHSSDS